MDLLSLAGIALALLAILGGNVLEGGTLGGLLNPAAAVVVFGGTLAATVLQASFVLLRRACLMMRWVFMPPYVGLDDGIDKVIAWSLCARKEGLLGLEVMADKEPERFARKALQLLVDGTDAETIRSILSLDMSVREQGELEAARVYDSMGGYAPTIGILGAVMGLIQVMTNLEDPSVLGTGIAAAFVATIYGVAFANLFLFPVASKLKEIIRRQSLYQEMMIEGIIAISEGENPRTIDLRLRGFIH